MFERQERAERAALVLGSGVASTSQWVGIDEFTNRVRNALLHGSGLDDFGPALDTASIAYAVGSLAVRVEVLTTPTTTATSTATSTPASTGSTTQAATATSTASSTMSSTVVTTESATAQTSASTTASVTVTSSPTSTVSTSTSATSTATTTPSSTAVTSIASSATSTVTTTASSTHTTQPWMVVPVHRVNCGGSTLYDWGNDAFSAKTQYMRDSGFVNGKENRNLWGVVVGEGSKRFKTEVLQKVRTLNRKTDSLVYQLRNAKPGRFVVRLHFAEIFTAAFRTGARVFDIYINKQLWKSDFDIFAQVGPYTHLVLEGAFDVPDSRYIVIQLTRARESEEAPMISAIDVDMLSSMTEVAKGHVALHAATDDDTAVSNNAASVGNVESAMDSVTRIEQGSTAEPHTAAKSWAAGVLSCALVAAIAGLAWHRRSTTTMHGTLPTGTERATQV